jgi:hypothetical protein
MEKSWRRQVREIGRRRREKKGPNASKRTNNNFIGLVV